MQQARMGKRDNEASDCWVIGLKVFESFSKVARLARSDVQCQDGTL